MYNPSNLPSTAAIITNHISEVINGSVGTATGYRKAIFFLQHPQRVWTQSSIQRVPGALSPVGKAAGA
jgi:hypothetical protein